jgi:quercetin 2,3-dioxygenase
MLTIRKSQERGHADHGWLESYHSFSFADFHDPRHMGFSDLRVINQDIIQPGQGFGTHGHRDMEIITYVLSGELAHKDSMGNVETIKAGELQRMTAGTGVQHSEYNSSKTDLVELLQIWILPETKNLTPGYEQIALHDMPGWQIVASQTGGGGALTVHQDVRLLRGKFCATETSVLPLADNRNGWLQVVRGSILLGDNHLTAGDAVSIIDDLRVPLQAKSDAEVLLFDLKKHHTR